MNQINKVNSRIYPVGKDTGQKQNINQSNDISFKEALDAAKAQMNVTLSKHAQNRIGSRNINLDSSHIERLNRAIEKAREKGIRDTLVLMDDKAFVVNVRNTTVITAADKESLKEKVFTNIDGAVII
ncbi:MAG: hypothetical protein HPY66_0251 [Firmicutes bacterium]|nr:hypothetical protein [Bacillota bacterium]